MRLHALVGYDYGYGYGFKLGLPPVCLGCLRSSCVMTELRRYAAGVRACRRRPSELAVDAMPPACARAADGHRSLQ